MTTKQVSKKIVLTTFSRNLIDVENMITYSVYEVNGAEEKSPILKRYLNKFKTSLQSIGFNLNKPFKIVKLNSRTLTATLKEIDVSPSQKIYFFSFFEGRFYICDVTGAKTETDVQIPLCTYAQTSYASFGSRAGLKRCIKNALVYALIVDKSQSLSMNKYIRNDRDNLLDEKILNRLKDKTTRLLNVADFLPCISSDNVQFRQKLFKFSDTIMTFSNYNSVNNTILNPFLDKSGYCLEVSHTDLKERLKRYKAKKRLEGIVNRSTVKAIEKDMADIFLKLAMNVESGDDLSQATSVKYSIKDAIEMFNCWKGKLTDEESITGYYNVEYYYNRLKSHIEEIKQVLNMDNAEAESTSAV